MFERHARYRIERFQGYDNPRQVLLTTNSEDIAKLWAACCNARAVDTTNGHIWTANANCWMPPIEVRR